MARAHSEDFRKKVLEHVEAGHGKAGAARLFGISERAVYAWLRLHRETGSLKARYTGRRASKLTKEKLEEQLRKTPDAYLEELAEKFSVSVNAVWKACKRYQLTRKKRAGSTKKETRDPGRHSGKN